MSSLAELPELVGFFSYSRRDDDNSDGALSRLRSRIHKELSLQLGREVRLWQDTTAIAHGTLWDEQINAAIAESSFFIPIVTPSALASQHCKFEFSAFLGREAELNRNDLVFPILYIRVPVLSNEEQRGQNEVLKIIHARQYADWTKSRLNEVTSPDVANQIAKFCEDIVEALQRPWLSPEERQRLQELNERQRVADEEARKLAEAKAQKQADEAARRKGALDAEKRSRQEAAAKAASIARAEDERRKREEKERLEKEPKKPTATPAPEGKIVSGLKMIGGVIAFAAIAAVSLTGLMMILTVILETIGVANLTTSQEGVIFSRGIIGTALFFLGVFGFFGIRNFIRRM